MQLTITGWFVILFTIILISKKKVNALLDVRLIILINYFNFWGKVDKMEINLENDLILSFSFLICYATICLFAKKKYNRAELFYTNLLSRFKLGFQMPEIKKKVQIRLLILFIVYTALYTYIMSQIYGSYENALTRFYVKSILNADLYAKTSTLLSITTVLMLFLLMLVKLSNTIYQKSNIIFTICLILMYFVIVPGGSRGGVLTLITVAFFADLYVWIVFKKKFYKTIFRPINGLLLFLALYSIFLLSDIRYNSYGNISSLIKDLSSFQIKQGVNSYTEKETDLMMSDYYHVIDVWGTKKTFLPITYTATTILVNPIPRIIWHEKPVGFGRMLTAEYNGVNTEKMYDMTKEINSASAVGVCGEGWANGGMLGVIVYSILFGILAGFCTKISQIFFFHKGYFSIIIGFFFWRMGSSWVRGDLLSGFTQPFYPLLILTIILFLISHKKKIVPIKN